MRTRTVLGLLRARWVSWLPWLVFGVLVGLRLSDLFNTKAAGIQICLFELLALAYHVRADTRRGLTRAQRRPYWLISVALGVNLSPLQLARPDLAEEVLAILHATGFDPRGLVIEITGSDPVDDRTAVPHLEALRARGVRVVADVVRPLPAEGMERLLHETAPVA